MKLRHAVTMGLSAALLLGALGCTDQKKNGESQLPDQSANERIRQLEDQLAQAERDRVANQERLLAMQNELDRLRDQAAKAGAPAAGWSAVPGGAMTAIEGAVLFDSGKAGLKSSGKNTLNDIATAIREKFPNHEIYVFGHTDSDPIRVSGWKDNYELSCQRSLSVLRYLRTKGVKQPIAACGWGEHRPVAAGDKTANRRVEIYAMVPKQ